MAMFFNIREYVGFDKQDELLEMIGMTENIKGLLAELRHEGRKEIIEQLLKTLSIDSVSSLLEMDETEIQNILEK